MKILVVDDDRNICELICLYLSREGYQTECAYNGREAIEKFKNDPPALVVLDLMLPEIDGYGVCREIRQISNIPIIMLTAKSDETDELLGYNLGIDEYITKPFELDAIVKKVEEYLGA